MFTMQTAVLDEMLPYPWPSQPSGSCPSQLEKVSVAAGLWGGSLSWEVATSILWLYPQLSQQDLGDMDIHHNPYLQRKSGFRTDLSMGVPMCLSCLLNKI